MVKTKFGQKIFKLALEFRIVNAAVEDLRRNVLSKNALFTFMITL